MAVAKQTFAVAMTADFSLPEGAPRYPTFDLHELRSAKGLHLDFLAEDRPTIGADQTAGHHGLIVLSPKVTAETVSAASDLLAIGRFGVGFDSVDVAACTAADVAVYIAAGAVDRSVAEATLAWMLALTHRVLEKDRLVRDGRWDEQLAMDGLRAARADPGRRRPGRDWPWTRRPGPRAGHGAHARLRPGPGPGRGPGYRRDSGFAGRSAQPVRFRFDPLPAQRAHAAADRRAGSWP